VLHVSGSRVLKNNVGIPCIAAVAKKLSLSEAQKPKNVSYFALKGCCVYDSFYY